MVYLDNAATTKPSKNAIKKAENFLDEDYFNPSALYRGGLSCAKSIKDAKESILSNLGLSSSEFEVVFTSCGTESDNLAVFCAVKRGVFITDSGEHAAIYRSFEELARQKKETVIIPIEKDGRVNVDELISAVKTHKANFVSVMHVNNETGAINDISSISDELKKIDKNIVFHADGVQSYGKIPFKFSRNIDLYSVSAHKIGGLKGVGALVKKRGVNLSPLIFGGGQENGLRSGTENVFGIKVFQYAGEEKFSSISDDFACVSSLNNFVRNNLDGSIFTVISGENSSPYILSISAVGLRGEVLMHLLEERGFIVGNGSACSSKNKHSRVLKACGHNDKVLDGAIRISFSAENEINEIKEFTCALNDCANSLKGIMG